MTSSMIPPLSRFCRVQLIPVIRRCRAVVPIAMENNLGRGGGSIAGIEFIIFPTVFHVPVGEHVVSTRTRSGSGYRMSRGDLVCVKRNRRGCPLQDFDQNDLVRLPIAYLDPSLNIIRGSSDNRMTQKFLS